MLLLKNNIRMLKGAKMFFRKLFKRLGELEQRVAALEKEKEELQKALDQKLQTEFKLQQIKLDAAIENLKNLLEMYNMQFAKEIGTLFGDDFIEKVKAEIYKTVEEYSKKIVSDTTEEFLYDQMKKFLTFEIRKAVIEKAGETVERGTLDYIVTSIVDNVMPQIMIDVKSALAKPDKSASSDEIIKGAIEIHQEVGRFDRSKEFVHKNFDKMLECIKCGLIPMLVGPAGTGKSTSVEQVARAMNLPFRMANRVSNTFEIIGYNDAEGRYVPTQFYEAYTNGGIFFFDEIDGSDPEALVTINTAIAQGFMAFPCGMVKMHPDFHLVAAGNTYGTGADAVYCGRNQLDSATLDRFVVIEWDYDKDIEQKLVKNKNLLKFAWDLRRVIQANHLKIIISTRGIIATDKLIGSKNFSLEENIRANLLEGVDVDTLNIIKGGLINICGYKRDDKYIKIIDSLIEKCKTSKGGKESQDDGDEYDW